MYVKNVEYNLAPGTSPAVAGEGLSVMIDFFFGLILTKHIAFGHMPVDVGDMVPVEAWATHAVVTVDPSDTLSGGHMLIFRDPASLTPVEARFPYPQPSNMTKTFTVILSIMELTTPIGAIIGGVAGYVLKPLGPMVSEAVGAVLGGALGGGVGLLTGLGIIPVPQIPIPTFGAASEGPGAPARLGKYQITG